MGLGFQNWLSALYPSLPFKYKVFLKDFHNRRLEYLDVGCGYSVITTKRLFPKINYYGIDVSALEERYTNQMHSFYNLDLTKEGSLDIIDDNKFDLVSFSHVIEHIPNGLYVVKLLCNKIKPMGRIYIEFPNVNSLSLPSKQGTLNFCDDDTHIRVYDIKEIANVLLENDFKIIKAGRRKDLIYISFLPFLLLLKLASGNSITAGYFWDLLGFADYVYAEKRGK